MNASPPDLAGRPRWRSLVRAAWRGALATVAIALCLIAVALGVAVSQGYRPVVVLTGSMGETAPPGALAIAGPTPAVTVGDVLVMRTDGRATVTHRVVAIEQDATGAPVAVTRGDANPDVDPVPYLLGDRELTVRWVVPRLGRALMEIREPTLGLTLAGFVVLVIVFGTLRRIWAPRHPTSGAVVDAEPSEGVAPTRHRARLAVALATSAGVLVSGGGVALSLYAGVDHVTANQFSTLACFDARLDDVQRGQLVSSGNGVTSVAIAPVDPARSFLVFTASSASGEPDESVLLGRLASPTSIEFERTSDGTGNIAVEWSLVEFACGVSVQRGEVVGTGAGQIDVPITAVDPAASFVLASGSSIAGSTDFGGGELRTVELLDADTIRISAAAPIAAGSRHAWQVVTFEDDDDARSQTVSGSLASGATSAQLALATPVDPASTFVLASARSAGSGAAIGNRLVRARLVDATTIEIARQGSSGSVDVVVQVVELRDGSTVHRGVLDLSAGQASTTAVIPPIAMARSTGLSTVALAGAVSGGSTGMTADDVVGEAAVRVRLLDARTVELERDATSAPASFAWQVITWGGPGWADLESPFRQRIDITAGAVVAPDGYTTSLVVDHAELVAEGLSMADGSDLRIWRYDGTAWTELDRVLDDASGWNAGDTTLWFRTQEPIAAGQTISYWLYFGDDTPAAPLDDPANVWLVVEGFDDGTLGAFEDRTGNTGWYRAEPWTRRVTLTVDPSAVGTALTDELVLVRLGSADLAAHAQPDGSDIRFTAADGTTPLAHEIEHWDHATGTLTAWVRVPHLSASAGSPTRIELYYGASDSPRQADPRTAWADAVVVWQLAADPAGASPALDDVGPSQHDGVALADATGVQTASGPAVALDGALDRLESSPLVLPDGALTVSTWFQVDTIAPDAVLAAQGDPTGLGVFELAIDGSGSPKVRFRLRVGGAPVEVSGGTISAGTWHHAAATWDGATVRLFVDGVQVAAQAATGSVLATAPAPVVLGADPTGGRGLDGTVGQVRLDDAAWSPARVRFAAANLAAPSSTVTASAPAAGTWFDQGTWTARHPLGVESDMVAGPLTDYPLLVQLTDLDLVAGAQSDGDDLVFTAADGVTRLDHQIEAWNPVSGELTAWVRVPALDDTSDVTLYLYRANPTAVDQADPVGVWGPDADLIVLD